MKNSQNVSITLKWNAYINNIMKMIHMLMYSSGLGHFEDTCFDDNVKL